MPTGQELVDFAEQFVGKIPYLLGSSVYATAQHKTADCSSFTQYVYTHFGIDLPRTADRQAQATVDGGKVYSTSGAQYATGKTVSLDSLELGDLVFFGGWNTPANPPGFMGIQHVGMYAGYGQVVEEGGCTQNVNVCPLSSFKGHIITATRVNGVTPMAIPAPIGTVTISSVASTRGIASDGTSLVEIPLGQTVPCYGRAIVYGTYPGPAFLIVVGTALVAVLERNTTANNINASGGAHTFTITRDDGVTYPPFS
jgi:hypothetical protein